MRPGALFVGLFAALMLLYFLVSGSIGAGPTFLLQGVVVAVLLAAVLRRRRRAARTERGAPEDGAPPGRGR